MTEKEPESINPFEKQMYSIEIAGKEDLPFLQIFGLTAENVFDALDLVRMECLVTETANYSIYTLGFLKQPTSKMLLELQGDIHQVGIWYKSSKIYYGAEDDDIYLKPDGCYFDGARLQESMSLVKKGYCVVDKEDVFMAVVNADKNILLPLFEQFINETINKQLKVIFEIQYTSAAIRPGFYTAPTTTETLRNYLFENHQFLFNDGFISFGLANLTDQKQLIINEHKYLEYCTEKDSAGVAEFKNLMHSFSIPEYEETNIRTIGNFGHIHINFKSKENEYEDLYKEIITAFELTEDN
jgi:hypothetical protein